MCTKAAEATQIRQQDLVIGLTLGVAPKLHEALKLSSVAVCSARFAKKLCLQQQQCCC